MSTRIPVAAAVHRVLSAAAIAATAVGVSTTSHAQEGMQEIVVTGSRIQVDPNLVTSSPVIQVKPQEFEFRGISRAEDLLNDLPQIVPELSANDSNGSTGTATLDLRGFGSDRTLVLTNGHRMGFGDVFALAPDINQVPASLIERVEVLTGGASSTYGSDAIAGVVNFIMRKDFEGVEFSYQYSFNQHHQQNQDVQDQVDASGFRQADSNVRDGYSRDANVIVGINSADGRGNITAYLGYRDTKPVFQADRDFSSCALSSTNGVTCGGSATSAEGLFSPFDGVNYFTVEGNEFVPGVPLYNYGPLNHFQRPDERYTAGLFGHFEANENFDVYTEFQFMDDRSLAQIAPSGAFFVTSSISCDNPFLSAQQLGVLGCSPGTSVPWYIGRRNVEGGPRFDDLRHTTYRALAGMRGEITENWSYDAFANFSRLVRGETYHNDMSTTRIIRALNVVADPVTGEPTCQSVIDGSDTACVPWNVFQEGGVTQEAIDYLTLPLFADAEMTQDQYVAFVAGDLGGVGLTSPAASEGLQIVLGGEYRNEKMDFDPDQGFQSGDGAGQGGPIAPVNGQIKVKELFSELKIPIVQDKPLARSISIDLGYRYSDYNTGVTTDTYKAGGEWSPTDAFKIRGGYSRAVRAGNLVELFQPSTLGLWSEGGDPCAGPAPTLTEAQCALTGVPSGSYGIVPPSPAGQYNGIFGGNVNLNPEKSDSYSVGAVFTPENLVPGLSFTVDYWTGKTDDVIGFVEPNTIITECGLTGDSTLCGLIHRSALNGNLWVGTANFVTATNVNLGSFEAAGYDVTAAYSREIGNAGSLAFTLRGTYIDKWDQQELPGGEIDNCVGLWGGTCSRPIPEWKHVFSTVWNTPWDLSIFASWRMVGSVDEFSEDAAAFDAGTENYLDLAFSYTANFFGETELNLGVSNVFDNDPPANGRFGNVAVFGNGNTIGGSWDALGRFFFVKVTQNF